MFKHYYKDTLIRTSKTHQYKFALINKNTLAAATCSRDMKGIEKMISELSRNLKVFKAVRNGTYVKKDRYSSTAHEIEAWCVKRYGSLDKAIEDAQQFVDQFIVVELEIR